MVGIKGKISPEIAKQYGISSTRVRQWAKEHNLPYIGTEDRIHYYIFDEAAEKAFINRPKKKGKPEDPNVARLAREGGVTKQRVRAWADKHGVPRNGTDYDFSPEKEYLFLHRHELAKHGRPRKERPVDTAPKRPVGRPRKNPPAVQSTAN
jgi:DNA-binding transcriptional MerR regulator